MHVLIARRAVRVAVALSVLLASGFAAQGLTGQSAKAGVVCGGESCSVYLGAFIHLTGDRYGNNPITVPPPPCWYASVSGTSPAEGAPAGAAVPFDKFVHAAIKTDYGTWSLSDGGSGGGGAAFFGTFKGTADSASGYPHYAHPASGSWYGLDADGSAQGQACVGSRPWLAWVPAGAQPPPPTVPPLTLAIYALQHLNLPGMAFKLNPPGNSYVSLPTFVRTELPGLGQDEFLPGNDPYRWVTASIPQAGEYVTVWAIAEPLQLNAGTGTATPYTSCGVMGSRWSAQQMAAAGANTPIDCGVTYRAPSVSGPYTLSGNIVWRTVWAQTANHAVPGNRPVPGGPLNLGYGHQIKVAEVQSLNN